MKNKYNNNNENQQGTSSSSSNNNNNNPPAFVLLLLSKFYDWLIKWKRGLTDKHQLEKEFLNELIIGNDKFIWCNANGKQLISNNNVIFGSSSSSVSNTTTTNNNNLDIVYGDCAAWLTFSYKLRNVSLVHSIHDSNSNNSNDSICHLVVGEVWETYCIESSSNEITTAKQISVWMIQQKQNHEDERWLLLHLHETYIKGHEPPLSPSQSTLEQPNLMSSTTDNKNNKRKNSNNSKKKKTNKSSSLLSSLPPIEEHPTPPWATTKVNIDDIIDTRKSIPSLRRHVASMDILDQYNAKPLLLEGDQLIGISVCGWDIGTSQGPIGDSIWFERALDELEPLGQYKKQQQHQQKQKRRLVLPEMVFPLAHVVLDYCRGGSTTTTNNSNGDDLLFVCWDAMDCLKEWSKCHQAIPMPIVGDNDHGDGTATATATTRATANTKPIIEFRGVSVLQSSDAKLWERNLLESSASANSNSSGGGDNNNNNNNNIVGTTEYHYDWTYSTPFYGHYYYHSKKNMGKTKKGSWTTLQKSAMPMHLLTDQSIPILYFDHVVLLEDDLHDNGLVQYTVKVRVMPTCAYILSRLFVRVDHVLIRVRDCRFLVDFGTNNTTTTTKLLYRDISWRECMWDDLNLHNLPTDIRAWKQEDNNKQETPTFNRMLNLIPFVELPNDIPAYAVLSYGE